MMDQGGPVFPIVHSLEARPSDDGVTLLVEATAFDGSVLRFAIPVDNVKHFIAFLLVWVGQISAGQAGGDDTGAAGMTAGQPAHSGDVDCDRRIERRRRISRDFRRPRRAGFFHAVVDVRAARSILADGGRVTHDLAFVACCEKIWIALQSMTDRGAGIIRIRDRAIKSTY
jgi:hypothetical protein